MSTTATRQQWMSIVSGFLLYSLTMVAGAMTGISMLNVIGTLLLFIVIAFANYRRLFSIELDATVYLSLALITLSLLVAISYPLYVQPLFVFKHISFYVLYIVIYCLNVDPLYSCKERRYFFYIIFSIVVLSIAISGFSFNTRISGLFVNPNDFACVILALLLFLNERKDRLTVKLTIHATICLILFLSGTTGAILSYFAGMVVKLFSLTKNSASRMKLQVSFVLCALLAFTVAESFEKQIPMVNRIGNSLRLAIEEAPYALSGNSMNIYRYTTTYAVGETSGIWRLYNWRNMYDVTIADGFWLTIFGHGIGSTSQLNGIKAHNDYLRVLLEQGVLGLVLNAVLVGIIVARIDQCQRYAIYINLVYLATENNLDNYFFMFMLVAFLASAQRNRTQPVSGSVDANNMRTLLV